RGPARPPPRAALLPLPARCLCYGASWKWSKLVELAANDGPEIFLQPRIFWRVIACRLLRFELDPRVGWNEPGRDGHTFADLDSGFDDRVKFHVRHRNEAIDPVDTEPVQHVGHQLLEARILDARDAFGALEIGCRLVAARLALPRVVDEEF